MANGNTKKKRAAKAAPKAEGTTTMVDPTPVTAPGKPVRRTAVDKAKDQLVAAQRRVAVEGAKSELDAAMSKLRKECMNGQCDSAKIKKLSWAVTEAASKVAEVRNQK